VGRVGQASGLTYAHAVIAIGSGFVLDDLAANYHRVGGRPCMAQGHR
jgi:hypothetical protein